MKKWVVSVVAVFLVVTSLPLTMLKAEANVQERVQILMSSMTLEQKVGQMLQPDTRSITPQEVKDNYIGSILSGGGASPSTGNTAQDWANRLDAYQEAAIEGFGIPLLYGVDAVHGHNNVQGATIFPHNIGLGQADDADLMKRIGEITAKEMRATGAHWTFTPTLGLPKNERWGRTYECFGEDADLSAELGAAYIEGSQGDLGAGSAIATAKHFVGEGITTGGVNQGNVAMEYSSEEFQDILDTELLVPYEEAISTGVKSVMISYSSINGVKCHGNQELITDLLKGELGFKGIVVSDYNGIDQIEGNLTYQQQAVKGVNAGIDMLMVDSYEGSTPKWKLLKAAIIKGVNDGQITEARINDAVSRILAVKFEMGFMDDFNVSYSNDVLLAEFGSEEHREVAREAVRKSLTLLKNTETDDDSTILLDLKNMKKIVVAGSSADDIGMQCGGWTMTWQGATGNITKGTTIFSGLQDVAGDDVTIDYNANGYFADEDYEAAIVVVGESPYAEYAGDRGAGELKLSSTDILTINRIKNSHPDLPIIAVLTTGRPITIADQIDDFDAIVMAGLPGSEGAGVADVLLGEYDFSGNLSVTWPWYRQDIEEKFSDPSKVLFEYGRGLTKAQTTAIKTSQPNDPNIVDLAQTNGVLEAESFVSKHNSIVLENNGTSIGYFWDGYDVVYRVKVPETARYTLTLNAATANSGINAAVDIYVDGKLFYQDTTALPNTGGWGTFRDLEMSEKISLPAGVHEVKIVSRSRDFNVDKFKFTKYDNNYEEPVDVTQENVGTGALIKEGAVSVTMSSSENSQSMSWYSGNQEIENKNANMTALDIRNGDSSDLTTIVVNDDKEYQSVLGLGTSIEESTVNNMIKMSPETRKQFITQLLDPVNGMGNTLLRVTIGTSDFTAQSFYTYYDGRGTELSGNPDWQNVTNTGFSIQKDRDYGIIGVIKEIQQVAKELGVDDQLKFFASSWTPPGWMKTATSSSNSYSDNDKLLKGGRLNDDYIDDLAKYYVRYIEEYKKEGIPIYAMTLQNEPLLEIDYPSCYITGSQEAKLAKYIKEELSKSAILNTNEKDVKVWAFDHNFDGAESYVAELFASGDGRDNVDGIAFHPYGGVASTMGSLYNRYKDEYTMHLTERSVWGTSGANDIINWFRNGSESYNGWVTMLDSKIGTHQWVGTPDPTMFVQDANNRDRYWCTPEVYIIGQFSKYVRPGYIRIDSNNGSNSSVTNVAFKDPDTGKIVLIVTNQSGVDQNFKVVLEGTQFNATLPAGNVATYIWDPVDSTSFKAITDDLSINDATISGSGQIDNGELGYISDTTAVDYLVNVKEAGSYRVTFDVAAGGGWDIDLPVVVSQGDKELGRASIRRYVWWQEYAEWSTYSTIQTYVTFEEAGLQTFRLTFPQGGLNFKGVHFVKEEATQSLPGILNTENYFNAYGIVHEATSTPNFGFIDRDDYIDYKVNVQVAGEYTFDFEVATNNGDSGVWIDSILEDQTSSYVGGMEFTNTGSTDNYSHQKVVMTLAQGEQTLRIKFRSGGINFRNVVVGQGITIDQDTLVEGSLKNKSFIVHLVNGEFIETLSKDNWNIGLPQGVDFTLQRENATTVKVTLISEATIDFDNPLLVICQIAAAEFNGMAGTSLLCNIKIDAIDDDELLVVEDTIAFNQSEVLVSIEGGTFNDRITGVNMVSLTGSVAKYVTIDTIEKVSNTQIKLSLLWDTMYGDSTGTITIANDGYDDGNLDLTVETIFKATDALPTPIAVDEQVVTLSEVLAYRSEGSLKTNPSKGNYLDFYLDVEDAGEYMITYKVKDSEAVSNALKISGGAGLATDNLASISFGKFWDNSLEYRSSLSLLQGKQTLRFEMNADGFEISEIKLQKIGSPIIVDGKTTIMVADLIDGSKTKGWGIELKNGIKNIGCGEAGAYQDYQVDIQKAGVYNFSINGGGNSGNTPQAVLQVVDGTTIKELGRIDAPKTGDWDTFVDSDSVEVHLPAGKQVLRIYDDVDGFNYRSFTLDFVRALDVVAPIISGENAIVYKNTTLSIIEILALSVVDDVDGDIIDDATKVTITTDYDATLANVYTVSIVAIDAVGNEATMSYTISVVNPASLQYDATPIVIGSVFDPMKDILVLDNDGSEITNQVSIKKNTVNTNAVGEYEVVYEVIDSLGTLTTLVRKVTVVKGTIPEPNIEITPDVSKENIDGKPEQDRINTVATSDSTMIEGYIALTVGGLIVGVFALFDKKRKVIQ